MKTLERGHGPALLWTSRDGRILLSRHGKRCGEMLARVNLKKS